MSSDPEQEYFADGMTEELLNLLAKVPTLRVTARTSSFFFKGKNLPVVEIAEILNVKHILEGSVRRSGNRVRITAQLIDAQSDTHLWSETYDRDLEDIFEIQDEVAGSIAKALVDSFEGLDTSTVSRPKNLAAFEAYRTGRLLWWRRSPKDLHKAIELFKKAVEHDPQFAPAYAAIADSWLLLVPYGEVQILDGVGRAKTMIEKALALNPESTQGIAAQGLSDLIIGRKDEAEASLRRAIALDEEYIPAYVWLSVILGQLGRNAEQGAVLQEALARDPLNEILNINYAANLYSRGEYASAKALLEGQLRIRPEFPTLLLALADLMLSGGELVEAWSHAKHAYDLDPANTAVIIVMARAWIALGEFEAAEKVLLVGREQAHSNVDIKLQHLTLLLIEGRAEDAQRVINQTFGKDFSILPEAALRTYHHRKGLLEASQGNYVQALEHLEQALDPDETKRYDDNQVFILSTVSLLHRALGDPEKAEQRLQAAERVVGHARVNGIDNTEIYYSIAAIFALRGENTRAMQTLQKVYNKGWGWFYTFMLKGDGRMDSLRDDPAFIRLQQQITDDQNHARLEVQKLQAANG